MSAYVYILKCADGSYYVGSTERLRERFEEHTSGNGAVHTSRRLPVELVFYEKTTDIKTARIREKEIKGWSRIKKEKLIDSVKWQHAFALGVYAIIANDQNEILLVHHIDKDHWMLPGGGVEVGESLTDALKREIEEEASFAIDNVQLFVVNEKPSKKQIIYVFTAKIQKQLPFKTNVETDERKFFSENSLPEKITDSSKQRIQAFFNKITPGSILTS